MLTWDQLLASVLKGFKEALKQNPTQAGISKGLSIEQIMTIAETITTLDQATKDKSLKEFFASHILPTEVIDQLAKSEKMPIMISSFDPACLRPADYDLRLGDEVYVTAEKLPRKLTDVHDTVAIKPGEFGILTTHEYIYVPRDHLGLISLRFNFKKLGLVNISGFHVDPGFTGKIIFSVFNTGPRNVVLRFKEPVFMIMFEKLENPVEGGYQGSFNQQKHIPVDVVTALGGQSVSVVSLDKRLARIETEIRILEGLLIGIAIAILTYVAGKLANLF